MTFVDELLVALEDPRVREVIAGLVMCLASHDERFKEQIGEIAVRAVDRANADLTDQVEKATA